MLAPECKSANVPGTQAHISLCVLSAPPAGLQFTPDHEEWEVVFPAFWRREPVDSTAGGSGASADPGSARGFGGGRTQVAGSSREVRSVASIPLQEPADGRAKEPQPGSPPPLGIEEDEELESQELPRASSGASTPNLGIQASWPPPPTPQPPPSPPPAEQAKLEGEEVLLRIPAFSRDLYLLLRRDGRFLAPRFQVEQWPVPRPSPSPSAAGPQLHAPANASCFYTGTVLQHPGSLASFSTCGGGLVSTTPSQPSPSMPHPHSPPPLCWIGLLVFLHQKIFFFFY